MILKCPACSTRFIVPDPAFGAKPRRVRCGKCRHEWLAEPPAALPVEDAVILPEPEFGQPEGADTVAGATAPAAPAIDFTPPPAEPAPIPQGSNLPVPIANRQMIMRAMMALAALLLIAVIGGAYLYSTATGGGIFTSAPAAPQLAIEDVKTRYVEVLPANADNLPADQLAAMPKSWALVVEGTIRNKSADEVTLPQLILASKDSNGALINLYRPNVQMKTLPANGVTSFTYTLNDISDRVAEVTVQFGSGSETDMIQPSAASKPAEQTTKDDAPANTPPPEPADHGGH